MSALLLISPDLVGAWAWAIGKMAFAIAFLGFAIGFAGSNVRALWKGRPLPYGGLKARLGGKEISLETVLADASLSAAQLKELRNALSDLDERLRVQSALVAGLVPEVAKPSSRKRK
ncbi:MAG TPA: hypothetical protein VF541_14035 [Longimicrobium sp.]|jgi:hypothetical protein